MEEAIKTLTYRLNKLIEMRDGCRCIIRRKDKGFNEWAVKTRGNTTRKIREVRKGLNTLKRIQDGTDN